MQSRALIEGIIFGSTHPVSVKTLAELVEKTSEEVESELQALEALYASSDHGFALQKVAGGYQFRTKPELKEFMAKFYQKKPPRLTQATLEVLSIIGYKQPITRPEIERIRGVDCSGVLQTLLERELVEMRGRSDLPGRPVVYGTTPKFLEWFQISKLEDLPPLSEMEVLNRGFNEGADNLLELLSRDDGFAAESVAEMDSTLKNVNTELKDLEPISQESVSPPPSA